MKREGNKISILKIEKIPIFSHGSPKFGFGDEKKCEKMGKEVYGKRGKKTFVLTYCWYIVIIIFCILNKIFRVTFCMTWL